VNNRSNVKGFKALIAIRLKKEYITNDESSQVLAAKKADKRTNACN
jgi:hypothetical protein